MTEYILMLALLTLIGIYLTRKMVGNTTNPEAPGGAVGSAYSRTTKNIAQDEKP